MKRYILIAGVDERAEASLNATLRKSLDAHPSMRPDRVAVCTSCEAEIYANVAKLACPSCGADITAVRPPGLRSVPPVM